MSGTGRDPRCPISCSSTHHFIPPPPLTSFVTGRKLSAIFPHTYEYSPYLWSATFHVLNYAHCIPMHVRFNAPYLVCRCWSQCCIRHNTSAAASSEWRHSQIPSWHSLSDSFMAFKVSRVVLLSSVYYNCVSKISGSGLLIMHIIIYIYCYKIINCKFNLILQRIFGL